MRFVRGSFYNRETKLLAEVRNPSTKDAFFIKGRLFYCPVY